MDLKFQFQLQQELFEVQQELPQTNFLCPAQKAICQVVEVVVVEEEEEEGYHLLLASLAVLDMLVPYHKDHRQFRVFLCVTLKNTRLALKTSITACSMNYRMPHILIPSLNPTIYDVHQTPAFGTVIRHIASFPKRDKF